ncbi:hypothetical protein GWN26_05635 [Candidatus Saccharibacteria bacterium]|nr:hypothetical protein [Candidatus Saccharibacteria bacterium]NIV98643.1 hypothetical protein [Candidatus Saccharibacteria bacterium]NIW78896.1 hypothetical protein [Calditrichia bacterium]
MLAKTSKHKLGVTKKAEIMVRLINKGEISELYPKLTARQMQELRDYLENQIVYLSSLQDEKPLTPAEIKSGFEPIPNYYYKQDCREPLEACYNETCLASNPSCFSNKMKKQLQIILETLKKHLSPAVATNQS